MDNLNVYAVVLALVLFAGVALNRFSRFLKMPILLCFLGVGAVCGPYGLNLLIPMDLQDIQTFGTLAICFIMFSGGLQTSFKAIRSVFSTGTILATVGVLLTALISGVFIYFFSHFFDCFRNLTMLQSILCASIFASTDSAAVFAILRGHNSSLNPKLQNLLEYESGSNDPMAFLLTSTLIMLVHHESESLNLVNASWLILSGVVSGISLGVIVGLVVGFIGQWFYNWIQSFLEYNGLRFVVAVAVVLLCYGLSDFCPDANPLLACYVAGITMGNMRFNFKNIFIKFHDGLAWLMQILLFTVLGALFDYRKLFDFRNMFGVVLISLVLMFIARPLAVFLCMVRSSFTMRERIFTSWVGIRGSAPILLAAMVKATAPASFGLTANNLFYGVFTLVLLSILLQGSSMMWIARKLGLLKPGEEQAENVLEYNERADDREMVQFTVTPTNPLAGRTLANSGLNENSPLLLMIQRGRRYIQPLPDVVVQAGDTLNFLGERKVIEQLHRQFFPKETYARPLTFRQLWETVSKGMIRSGRSMMALSQRKQRDAKCRSINQKKG